MSANARPTKRSLKFQHAIVTNVGRVRERNEDLAASVPSAGLFVLADGMGGHPAGNVAAKLAVESALTFLTAKKIPHRARRREDRLAQAVSVANRTILDAAKVNQEAHGMGTTFSCIWVGKKQVHWAHVGDSRIYRIRGQKAEQMSRDHTVVQELIDKGQLDPNSFEAERLGHILTQAVGLEEHVQPDVAKTTLQPDDIFVLCSDGLSDLVPDEQITNLVLASDGDAQKAADDLVAAALAAGGHDNVTVVVVRPSADVREGSNT